MARKPYCVPALVLAFCALVLLVLTTVSMPTVAHLSTPFDLVRADRIDGQILDLTPRANAARPLESIKLGMWGYCTKAVGDSSFGYCSDLKYDYNVTLAASSLAAQAETDIQGISRNYTRGLLVGAVALAMTVVAFILSFIPHTLVDILSSVAYLLATLLTLVAFIIQIVFFVRSRKQIQDVFDGARVMPGPAFYFTLISIPLLFASSLAMCCGAFRTRRKEKEAYTSPTLDSDKAALRA